MPEVDKEGERYSADRPQPTPGFYLKGSHQLDWGMKNRLARVFAPATGRTVMLAIDHGYFQGPTTGLERIDLSIVPLLPFCDALFCTRGILRSVIPADSTKPMVLRASGGPSIFHVLPANTDQPRRRTSTGPESRQPTGRFSNQTCAGSIT